MLDPRTPVVVGVGQVTNRPDPGVAPERRPHPFALMVEAVRLAAADSGGRDAGAALLARAGSVAVVGGLGWQLANPALWVADALGLGPRELAVSAVGGNMPMTLLHRAAGMIGRGELDVAVVCGAECIHTRRALGAGGGLEGAGQVVDGWPVQDAAHVPAPQRIGANRRPATQLEVACGVTLPVYAYPLLEHSWRAAQGLSPEEHRARMGALWASFSDVAAQNPLAWLPDRRGPDEIVEPTPNNRMIASPYTKLCTANIAVDQAAAIVCCSVEAARAAGVGEDRWVFPLGGAEAHDHWFLSERVELHRSPAMRLAGTRALDLAGVGADLGQGVGAHVGAGVGAGVGELHVVDLYSCFPVVVEMAAEALGLDGGGATPLTATGGLTFFGGPGNNYTAHGIAAVVARLRESPGSVGLASGLGWYATKHAFGAFASRPPAHSGAPYRAEDVQGAVDALERCAVDDHATGPVAVETYTVAFDREGLPARGIVACRTASGARTWGTVVDPDFLTALADPEADPVGRAATMRADRRLSLD